jgi:predicted RNA-binding protein with PUA-like domain
MKSEPDEFSFDQLKKDKTTLWSGVRNYQARNFMMKEMTKGDQILFYHSNTKPPGVAGLATVSKEAVPDPTAFDKKSEYFDEKSDKENPRWFCVEVKYKKPFKKYVSLDDIKATKSLKDMKVVQRGMRLSIQPVTKKEFEQICSMGGL